MAEVLLADDQYASNKKLLPYRLGGQRSDMPFLNFYLDFFAQGKPAYVKINYMDFTEAISLIKRNGGIPVVAHPGHNLKGQEGIVKELLDLGAEGLEVFNNYHNEKQIDFFTDIAVRRKILITCGSDFHGKTKPLIRVGKYRLPERYEGYLRESVEELLC
jgi:predicted metal-dependent phosphoesterase TrpH